MSDAKKYSLGVDLGGTNVRVAAVNSRGEILASRKQRTPVDEGPEATANAISSMVLELVAECGRTNALGIGLGSPGPLSRKEKKIWQTPNLPGFDGFPLGTKVEELCSLPLCLDNDANCATYGEREFGAAKGKSSVVMLTLGTGIGGGVIEAGKLIYGKSDGAGELGHFTLYPNGLLCKCGNYGCFEQYGSATAIERRASEAMGAPTTPPHLLELVEKQNELAVRALQEIVRDLAIGVASLINIFEPEMVVMGGGIFTTGGGPLVPWLREEIVDRCFKSNQKDLEIVAAGLGGDAGVLGAAALARDTFAER